MSAKGLAGDQSASSNSSELPIHVPQKEEKASDDQTNENLRGRGTTHPLVLALQRIDPILQFLTKATGLTSVPLSMLKSVLPAGYDASAALNDLDGLVNVGVVHLQQGELTSKKIASGERASLSWDDAEVAIGFPPPLDSVNKTMTSNDPKKNRWGEIREKVGAMHGSTKTAAKKRLRALQLYLKTAPETQECYKTSDEKKKEMPSKEWAGDDILTPCQNEFQDWIETNSRMPFLDVEANESPEEIAAFKAFRNLMGFQDEDQGRLVDAKDKLKPRSANAKSSTVPTGILPQQAAYAGSDPAQSSIFGHLHHSLFARLPMSLWRAFGLTTCDNSASTGVDQTSSRRLYHHQVSAIEAAMSEKHTTVCTGTGSGKSLCFLVPVMTAAYENPSTSFSILLFPTKALAQDQFLKLTATIKQGDADVQQRIRIATLDGDTLLGQRSEIVKAGPNILFTNPDTLHAAILPNWKTTYKPLFVNKHLAYVIVDEAHLYEGVFGSHVALILARLVRVAAVNCPAKRTTFLASSATMPFPLEHFCRLFPIDPQNDPVVVVADDTSPRSAKHFFAWNPPLMCKQTGECVGRVTFPPVKQQKEDTFFEKGQTPLHAHSDNRRKKRQRVENPSTQHIWESEDEKLTGTQPVSVSVEKQNAAIAPSICLPVEPPTADPNHMEEQDAALAPPICKDEPLGSNRRRIALYRRHPADETALLFVRAIQQGTRCIAFAKTRNLVEWIYEKALKELGGDSPLRAKIESYRGGYSRAERKKIEEKLFSNDLLGVVATNALELGVDVGGIDLTLHCGYPSSVASLYQQAGRAGRGTNIDHPSAAVVVCFNSAFEQYLWRSPQSLLAKGFASSNIIPMTPSLVQGHLLCASEEHPLTGSYPATSVRFGFEADNQKTEDSNSLLSDSDLFGGEAVYGEALEALLSTGSVFQLIDKVGCGENPRVKIYKAHQYMKKAWTRVSIRSIEPVNYVVVDLSHPMQGGRMDVIEDNAVLDNVPYSRVFWHCHPGAIISHRGTKYKVASMMRPPPINSEIYYRRSPLACFVRPTNARYTTRPLSTLQITVIKQIERVDFPCRKKNQLELRKPSSDDEDLKAESSFAGCGAVSIKRTVHGYKKLSLVTRTEIGRSEISLPDMEYDSFGLWMDTDAGILRPFLGDSYGEGVHALSHALLAVAPLFAPGLVRSDLECDHSTFAPTRICLFDERAGGSGASEKLWKHFFRSNNLLEAAVNLLEGCSSCRWDTSYDAGCPACLHAPQCLKFNMQLSRKAAVVIGKHTLERLRRTELYIQNLALAKKCDYKEAPQSPPALTLTPRRRARKQALQKARELHPARDRQYVVGRPSWPMENNSDLRKAPEEP